MGHALINPIVGTVFPNFSLLRGTSRTLRVWQPRGPDNMDNWQECTETCRGGGARRMPVTTQTGRGRDRFDPALGAWASDAGFSESNHRQSA